MQRALIEAYGERLALEGQEHVAFPEPATVAAATPGELARLVGHRTKAAALGNVARAFLSADNTLLRHGPYAQADAWLQSIKGVGPWTSAFVLLRGLGRMERIPPPDRLLLEQVRVRYGPAADVLALGAHYGAYQGYWAHYLRAASI